MDLSPYLHQLREDLTSAASAGDERTRQTAAALSTAIEPAARLAIMNALSDLAAEVTTHLGGPVVEVRLDGRDVRVAVSGTTTTEPPSEDEERPPPPPSGDGGDVSRITLRLLDQIKSQAEEAASAQGVSLNSWLSHVVQGALHGQRPRGPWEGTRTGTGARRSRRGAPGSHGEHLRWGGEESARRIHGWVQG